MSDHAMALILKQAEEVERQAQLTLLSAQQELQGYRQQVAQIEKYRFDYCQQLTARGKTGLTASGYGHLNRFISQLDETLKQQREAANEFEDNVVRCQQYWMQCKKERRSIEWLIEKKAKEARCQAERIEQKQMDEFASLIYTRRNQNLR